MFVFQVVTGKEVSAASSVKCFQLRCQKHCRRDESYCPTARQSHRFCGANCQVIPAIAEPQDIFVCGHDIQHAAADEPSANGRIRTAIVLEACLFQLTFERVISGKRYDFDDNIDVLSCAHGRSCGVGHELARCAASNEHESIAKRPERSCHRFQQRKIWIREIHGSRSLSN